MCPIVVSNFVSASETLQIDKWADYSAMRYDAEYIMQAWSWWAATLVYCIACNNCFMAIILSICACQHPQLKNEGYFAGENNNQLKTMSINNQ